MHQVGAYRIGEEAEAPFTVWEVALGDDRDDLEFIAGTPFEGGGRILSG